MAGCLEPIGLEVAAVVVHAPEVLGALDLEHVVPVQVAVAATMDTDTSGAVDGMDVRRPADGSI